MDNSEALARLIAAARQLGNKHVERAVQEAQSKIAAATERVGGNVTPFPLH